MTSQVIDRMAVEVDGPGDARQGDAILCIHGLGATSNFYTPLCLALSGRYRMVRPDLPGSGRSPARDGLSVPLFAEAMARVVRSLGLERAHVIGHSLGSIVAQHLALSEPKLVRSLALLGPLLAPPEATRQGLKDRAKKARSEGMAEIAGQILQAATSTDTRNNQPVAAALVRELVMRQDPEGYARSCEALAAAEAAEIQHIACPTLLLTGDEDAVGTPSGARAMAERIPGARLVILPRCGHWTMLERPVESTAALKEFYAGRA
ncbi:MAG TPA: alpha/beta fold hydrolase [Dongiaceae bacterium]|jgi:pimeloyl-ACP methyl ester carboxylesterase|nr:alpha/beta fold hydrolase [Dongiaceae bacterium]